MGFEATINISVENPTRNNLSPACTSLSIFFYKGASVSSFHFRTKVGESLVTYHSLLRAWAFYLLKKTILVDNNEFGLSWLIHSIGSEATPRILRLPCSGWLKGGVPKGRRKQLGWIEPTSIHWDKP